MRVIEPDASVVASWIKRCKTLTLNLREVELNDIEADGVFDHAVARSNDNEVRTGTVGHRPLHATQASGHHLGSERSRRGCIESLCETKSTDRFTRRKKRKQALFLFGRAVGQDRISREVRRRR